MKTISDISKLLAVRTEQVCQILLPGGHQKGGFWIAGSVDGDEGKSLQVHLDGEHQGKWRDWAESDLRGDLVDLWMKSKGFTAKEALTEIRDFLGLPQPSISMQEKPYAKPRMDHKPLSPEGKILQWLTLERKIEAPTVAKFDIRANIREENGAKKGFVVFPCFSPSGQWVNSSYRGLQLNEDGSKNVFQDKGCAPCLFGWQSLTEADYASRSILICEGHIDAMTWRQWGIPALSVPNGNGNTWIDTEWDNLEVFETIYLSYDMDGKTASAMHKAISRLGHHRCMIVKLPEKDANDCLKKGFTAEDAKTWIDAAKHPTIADFVSLRDLGDRLMDEFFPKPSDAKPILLSLFNSKFEDDRFLIRPGELSLWTGISSHGKTTFLTYLFVQLAYNHEKCFICSLEMLPEKIAKKMMLSIYREKPICPQDILDFTQTLGEKTCFCDKRGYIGEKELLEMMEFAHKRYGVSQFLIDSLMRIEGMEEDYKAQGHFMTRLAEFCQKFKVHVHLVAHPRKTLDDAPPNANDIKGSSLMRNNVDNILIVSRNTTKEKRLRNGEITEEQASSEHDTEILVDKDREEGKLKAFKFKFVHKHHYFTQMERKLVTATPSEVPPERSNGTKKNSYSRK